MTWKLEVDDKRRLAKQSPVEDVWHGLLEYFQRGSLSSTSSSGKVTHKLHTFQVKSILFI